MNNPMLINGLDGSDGGSGCAVAPRPSGEPPRLERPDRQQRVWVDDCLDERLPVDHLVRTVWALVLRLNLSQFYEPIQARGSQPGRPAIDPQLLVALWLYATLDGVGNGRRLERLCGEHDAYRWLCGGVSVNYHTLNDFRVGNEKALDELFTQVLTVLQSKGLVDGSKLSQDSKRVRASAGSSSFHRKETLQELLAATRRYIEELKQQADEAPGESARQKAAAQRAAQDQQQRLEQALALLPELEAARDNPKTNQKNRAKPLRVSSTDPDARKMMMADGGVRPAYNLQFGADVASHAVLAVEVVQSSSDKPCSGPLRAQVERRTGTKVIEHLADEGYVQMEQIDQAEQAGVAMYVPLPTGKDGQPVTASRWDTPGTKAWRDRMQTPEAQAIYQKRFPVSERIHAVIQERFGLRQLPVRGTAKVRCVALWMALAFNVSHFAQALIT